MIYNKTESSEYIASVEIFFEIVKKYLTTSTQHLFQTAMHLQKLIKGNIF